jgi:hypothetical protein
VVEQRAFHSGEISMITDSVLKSIVQSTDQSIVIEIYDTDAVPASNGFDPATALKCFAFTAGISLSGRSYTRLISSIGKINRNTTESANTFQFTLDNLTREASQFEFSHGFQGCIVVARLISRSLSTDFTKSIILFAGQCDRPTTGTREQLPITAKGILSSVEASIPRRKFTQYDQAGRPSSDPLFEGFLYMPQYVTVTYSTREKKGGLLGLLGFKKTVMHTLQYSSYSDLDADKYVPIAFGRVQISSTHVAYVDVGTTINVTEALMEGPIEGVQNWRTDDSRFTITGGYWLMFGEAGGTTGDRSQVGNTTNPSHIGNAYYSRTAVFMTALSGSSVDSNDAPPNLIFVCFAMRCILPDSAGVWNQAQRWSDNAAAHTYFLLTDPYYYNLNANWIDQQEAFECFKYNTEYIFDSSNSDVLFIPVTGTALKAAPQANDFTPSGDSATGRYLASTGLIQAGHFKYLAGEQNAIETHLLTPYTETYDPTGPIPLEPPLPDVMPDALGAPRVSIDGPIEPPDPPPGGGGTPSLTFYLRKRYTCNVVVTEQMKLVDFLHKVIFITSRMYLTQGPTGKLRMKNKKPVDNALATAAISGTTILVDDVSQWVQTLRGFAVIDPNTANSEVRSVTSAVYPVAQNAITLTATSNIGVTAFAGCDGANIPATGRLTVNAQYPSGTLPSSFSIEGVTINFNPGSADSQTTMAGFIYASINAHPVLRRRYKASWSTSLNYVDITARWGNLTFNSALAMTHAAALADPTVAPTLTGASGGALAAGTYRVAYAFVNDRGQTLTSPITQVTLSAANSKITVSAISLPAGATAIDWFVSPAPNSPRLRLLVSNNGASFVISTPSLLSGGLPPESNRTGAEILRVEAVFSDRAEPRSSAARSNVLKASYKWLLGNRNKDVNRIDLKFRDSTQDFRLVELRLANQPNIQKTKVTNNQEVNGQGIDNYNQAYRIANGLLAEYRDAGFFYQWDSDKDALLLEEGDVVVITDDGSQTYNLPVRIETIEYTSDRGFLKASFIARVYNTQLYDDSVADRTIPVIIQPPVGGGGGTTVMPAPSNLTPSVLGSTRVDLTWNFVTGADSYVLQRSTSSDFSTGLVTFNLGNVTYYSDIGLTPSTFYYWHVKAVNSVTSESSVYSASRTATTNGLDSDAQAFITAAGITDATQKTALDELVTALKGANIWTKFYFIYPFVGGTAAAHKWNLKNPADTDAAYRLTFNGTFTHAATGITGGGAGVYGDTHLNANSVSLNSNHLAMYLRTNPPTTVTKIDMAANDASVKTWMLIARSQDQAYAQIPGGPGGFGNASIQVANTDSRGFYLATRTASNNANLWKNATKIGSNAAVPAGTMPPNSILRLLNYQYADAPSDREMAFASAGAGLTDTEATQFYTIVQNYQARLGRDV